MTQFVYDMCGLHVVHAGQQLLSVKGFFQLQDLHLRVDSYKCVSIALIALSFGLETPFIKVQEGSMDAVVLPIGGGKHGLKPWGHGVDRAVP